VSPPPAHGAAGPTQAGALVHLVDAELGEAEVHLGVHVLMLGS